MTLGDAHEFIAVDSPASQLVNQTFLVQVLSKSTVQNVKTSITLDPSIKAVSFYNMNRWLLDIIAYSWNLLIPFAISLKILLHLVIFLY
jgi:hypothetical protein